MLEKAPARGADEVVIDLEDGVAASAKDDARATTVSALDRARAILAALDDAERDGARGAVALDGEMVDEALRVGALRFLARARIRGEEAAHVSQTEPAP
jgi:citrate lyase beta subunit